VEGGPERKLAPTWWPSLQDFATTAEGVHGVALTGTCLAQETGTPELLAVLRERTAGTTARAQTASRGAVAHR
jgi:hypothetical protein